MTDVLIVGAGPAGLAAAEVCARNGLRVHIVDEFVKPGGRLLGQLHQEPDGLWWNGLEVAGELVRRVHDSGATVRCGASVYNLQPVEGGWRVDMDDDTVTVKSLLLATGAAEAAVPIPGWTLPGVMSIGAAQVMTNVHRVKVGQRGVVVGINILSVAIARELQLAGIEVASMALPSSNAVTKHAANPRQVMESMLRVAHLAPSWWMRYGSTLMKNTMAKKLALHFYPKNGVPLWGIPIQLRKAITEIVGDQQVEAVRTVDVDVSGHPLSGTEREVEVDFVCIAGGLYPLVELAAVAGCPFRYIPELGGHVPVHSEDMRTPLQGLYVAGNITGIESAKVAMAQGEVAGYSILNEVKGPSYGPQLEECMQKVQEQRKQATIQFHPSIPHGRAKVHTAFQQWRTEGKGRI